MRRPRSGQLLTNLQLAYPARSAVTLVAFARIFFHGAFHHVCVLAPRHGPAGSQHPARKFQAGRLQRFLFLANGRDALHRYLRQWDMSSVRGNARPGDRCKGFWRLILHLWQQSGVKRIKQYFSLCLCFVDAFQGLPPCLHLQGLGLH